MTGAPGRGNMAGCAYRAGRGVFEGVRRDKTRSAEFDTGGAMRECCGIAIDRS